MKRMVESSREKIDLNNEDRISELPLDIKEIILCFLPIQDAVRTTILSTKWRYCWTTIPNLIFDHRFSILKNLDCPALEKLTLIFCYGIFPINFHVPNLRSLHLVCSEVTLEYDIAGLENLTEYSYVLDRKPVPQKESSNVVKVLGSLQKIEKFSTGWNFLKYLAAGGCPSRLSQPLPYLKTLNIWEMNFADLSEISCLLCLIRSALNLSKLHISHCECFHKEDCECAGEEELKNYWIEDSEDCTIDHLKIVTFSNFMGLKAEFELVKLLLGHSPLLKTMCIHHDKGRGCHINNGRDHAIS